MQAWEPFYHLMLYANFSFDGLRIGVKDILKMSRPNVCVITDKTFQWGFIFVVGNCIIEVVVRFNVDIERIVMLFVSI